MPPTKPPMLVPATRVDWHVVLIKPLATPRCARGGVGTTFKYQADLLPWRRASLLGRRTLGWQWGSHAKQEEQRRCRTKRSRAAFPVPAGCLISSKVHHRPQLSARDRPVLEHITVIHESRRLHGANRTACLNVH